MKKKVLVTGGNGFLGGKLAAFLLEKGYSVTALVRSAAKGERLRKLGCEIAIGELPDGLPPNLCKGMDAVFHTAAMVSLWSRDWEEIYGVNVTGTTRMLEAASEAGVRRFIHTSSIAVFGSPGGSVSESMHPPLKSLSGNYSRSKYLAERQVMRFFRKKLIKPVILNPSVIVGKADGAEIPLAQTFRRMHKPMPFYSDTLFDIVSVDDVVKAHYSAYKKGKPGQRFIIGGKPMYLSEILALVDELNGFKRIRFKVPAWGAYPIALAFELLCLFSGKPPPLSREMLKFLRGKTRFSHKKAQRLLAYKPRLTDKALADSIIQAGAS